MGQIQTSLNSVCGMYRLVKGHLIYFGVYHPPITAGRGASPFPSISGPRSHRPGLLGQNAGRGLLETEISCCGSISTSSLLPWDPAAGCPSAPLRRLLQVWPPSGGPGLGDGGPSSAETVDWESPRSRVQAEAGGCILSPRNLAESVLGRAWGGGGVVDAAPTPTSGYKTMRSQGRCPPRCHSGGCCGVR